MRSSVSHEADLRGTPAHRGTPVLRWMGDNIFIKAEPAGNIKPDKEKHRE